MPLVVPVLRLGYVFLNVFDTFKTLRLPPPSARNGGHPSARAMSARKRAMKGVMTVWMIWACFTLYERWVETFVWLFVPFYSEIKSLFILFFLLTRAKGAEPVFLHVIRPIIKPYTVPLDALCDTVASFGDLLILVASIPVNYVLGFYRRWWKAYDPPQADPKTWHRDSDSMTPRPSAHRIYVSESNGDAHPAAKREVSNGSIKQTRSVIQPRSNAVPANHHQVWRPPASAYDEEVALNPHSGLPTPPLERQQRKQLAGGLAPIVAPKPVRAGNSTQFSGFAEDDKEGSQHAGVQQDFRKSLLLPREPRNPGSDGDLSDDDETKGAQPNNGQTHKDFDEDGEREEDAEMNGDEITARAPWQYEDEEEYETDVEEDVFNTTLATPGPRRRYQEDDSEYEDYLDDTMLTPPPIKKAFSVDSAATRSTSLSTTDAGSSLRTTRSLSSDGASLPGKKQRATPKYAGDDDKFSIDVPPRKAGAAGKPAAPGSRASTIGRTRGKALQASADADDSDVAEGDAAADAAPEGGPRVANGRAQRPKPPRGDSQGTIRGPSARGRGASTTRIPAATARAPSARIAAKERSKPVVKKAAAGSAKPIGAAAPKVVPKAAKPVQKDTA
ncbi:hypothetical protein LXA43DRAFT_1079686 [Ganoderma leucocontextum]|nr:hypothetical protein LXA43DRAFT_1079686 [Ganoderma leucocontextum]